MNYGAKQPSTDTQEGDQTSQIWDLKDYNVLLAAFEEPPRSTIRECKKVIREHLNINLYDLLNWFRNPDHARPPIRFASVELLGEYSYVENKVFSLDSARVSGFSKPLLRKIAQFKFNRTRRYLPGQTAANIPKAGAKAVKTRADISATGSTTSGDTIAIKSVEAAPVASVGGSLFDVTTPAVQPGPIMGPAHPPRKRRPAVVPQRQTDMVVAAPAEKAANIPI